jgi:hypothetical protein
MAKSFSYLRLSTRVRTLGRYRATRYLAAAVVATAALLGGAVAAVAATPPTLVVVVLGNGAVRSQPIGINCPGKCTATFAAGTSVALTPYPKSGSTFVRWGGSCTGTGTCTVIVAPLTAVAAQFVGGPTPQPTTIKYLAVPGPYSGSNGQNGGITFSVAPGGASMLNISIPTTKMFCVPGGPGAPFANDHLGILQVPIKPDGSFSATTSQTGAAPTIYSGDQSQPTPASYVKFTYTITGRFEAATGTTAASAAGTWREQIALASGPWTMCNSNEQSWTATLYREPTQQKAVVKPGDYSGSNGQNGGITFSVAPGGASMLNISIPTTKMFCVPGGPGGPGANDHLGILQVPIKPDGSFSATTSQTGVGPTVYSGGQAQPSGGTAKFTYMFAGYFEGPTPPDGALTVAGIWREDIVFASGATTMCTSDDQSWTATLQS